MKRWPTFCKWCGAQLCFGATKFLSWTKSGKAIRSLTDFESILFKFLASQLFILKIPVSTKILLINTTTKIIFLHFFRHKCAKTSARFLIFVKAPQKAQSWKNQLERGIFSPRKSNWILAFQVQKSIQFKKNMDLQELFKSCSDLDPQLVWTNYI